MARPRVNNGRRRRLPYSAAPFQFSSPICLGISEEIPLGDTIELSAAQPVMLTHPFVVGDCVVTADEVAVVVNEVQVSSDGLAVFVVLDQSLSGSDLVTVRFPFGRRLLVGRSGAMVTACPVAGVVEP
jgi:hypothetical protein